MPDDFSRAVTRGCGLYIGWVIGGLVVSLLGVLVMVIFFGCIGGMSLLFNSAGTKTTYRTIPATWRTVPVTSATSPLQRAERTEPAATPRGFENPDLQAQMDHEARKRQEAIRRDQEREIAEAETKRKAAETKRKAAETQLDLAKQLLKDGKDDRAIERLKKIRKDFPDTQAANEAARILKRLRIDD
jgi:hypothetical protein